MKKIVLKGFSKIPIVLTLAVFLIFSACSDNIVSSSMDSVYESAGDLSSRLGSGGSSQVHDDNFGKITAGEWNDLENWDFWRTILNENEFHKNQDYWGFYTNNRISVKVTSNGNAISNSNVELMIGGDLIWKSTTDIFGKAELWIGLFEDKNVENFEGYQLFVDGEEKPVSLSSYEEGFVEIEINGVNHSASNKVELAFIVDATGSMGDELEFLKDDLENVIQRVEQTNAVLDIATSTVFYRDEGDEYVTKLSDFTNDIKATLTFINEQSAGGGGGFPEAVHSALDRAIYDLQWSTNSKTRIAFLLLDAPPHYNPQIVDELHTLIAKCAEKGIKIIPITASGIDKETEFLMRFFAVSTNGTYTFITNHSGIGEGHIEASVGAYEVELLNDLLVRLINKYSGSNSI